MNCLRKEGAMETSLMNNDYLWDRSGEADPEVQQLEEILGTLRYQPRPLNIPVDIRPGRRHTFSPALAIAAAIALTAVAFGLWAGFSRRHTNQPLTAKQEVQAPPLQNAAGESDRKYSGTPRESPTQMTSRNSDSAAPSQHRPQPRNAGNLVVRNLKLKPMTPSQPGLTAKEQAQKDQLMLALRMVSAKLSIVQRKAQGAPALNVIRNQHPIG
jgi:hypothetical protein